MKWRNKFYLVVTRKKIFNKKTCCCLSEWTTFVCLSFCPFVCLFKLTFGQRSHVPKKVWFGPLSFLHFSIFLSFFFLSFIFFHRVCCISNIKGTHLLLGCFHLFYFEKNKESKLLCVCVCVFWEWVYVCECVKRKANHFSAKISF